MHMDPNIWGAAFAESKPRRLVGKPYYRRPDHRLFREGSSFCLRGHLAHAQTGILAGCSDDAAECRRTASPKKDAPFFARDLKPPCEFDVIISQSAGFEQILWSGYVRAFSGSNRAPY